MRFFTAVKSVFSVIWNSLRQALHTIMKQTVFLWMLQLSLVDRLCYRHPLLISGDECVFLNVWMCEQLFCPDQPTALITHAKRFKGL